MLSVMTCSADVSGEAFDAGVLHLGQISRPLE
jgi:hypothetical protein